MFADLNRHVVRPSQSLNVLYDHRDPLARLTRKVVADVSVFKELTETERSGISGRAANRQRIANLFPTAHRLLFVVSDRQRLAYSGARPILPRGVPDAFSVPPAV